MGGIGSGHWHRWNQKTTIEQTRRIDIRYMKKRGFLAPSTYGSLSWEQGGKPNGKINFTTHYDRLILEFRYKAHGGEWQPVTQAIMFDHTPCHYGKTRKWFLCPKCNKRVAVLCGEAHLFLCRHCNQLSYRSQNADKLERTRLKRNKLGNRIFVDYDNGYGYEKIKGMHQRTFETLRQQHSEINQEYEVLFHEACSRYFRSPNNT